MREAYIVDAVRTPLAKGKAGGAFDSVHPTDLLAHVLKALVERTGIDPALVDDVVTGCVSQAGEQSATPGRVAWLGAGLPEHVPATTIDRKCGSSQQAVHFAAQGIMSGAYDMAIACGVESMSRVPMGCSRIGADPYGALFKARYVDGLVSQGVSSEFVCHKWGLEREALDAFSARSHALADHARSQGWFEREIIGVPTAAGMVLQDETIRAGTTAEKLGQLKASFYTEELANKYPQLQWQTTAGNASQLSDGAAGLLVVSEAMLKQLNLTPRAKIKAVDVCGDDPFYMLTAPIASTQRILKKSGIRLEDIDLYEVNEAFASVPLAWLKELQADVQKLNVRGGSIALGHPLGASGARIMTSLLHALEDGGKKMGLQTMCEAGGMANTTMIEIV